MRRALAHTVASTRSDWCTPQVVLDRVLQLYPGVFLDPATNIHSDVNAAHNFVRPGDSLPEEYLVAEMSRYRKWEMMDGLEISWADYIAAHGNAEVDSLVYVNPPYGRRENKVWAHKIREEARAGCHILALVPANTETNWFANYWQADALCFWGGRLHFKGGEHVADFASAIIYFGPHVCGFSQIFSHAGAVVTPNEYTG